MQLIVVFLLSLLVMAYPARAQTVGAMDYNAATGRFRVYDGSSWSNMGNILYLPLGACPVNGRIEYDPFLPDLKYCGGGQWRSFSVLVTIRTCSSPGTWQLSSASGRYEFCNGLVWVNMNSSSLTLAGL